MSSSDPTTSTTKIPCIEVIIFFAVVLAVVPAVVVTLMGVASGEIQIDPMVVLQMMLAFLIGRGFGRR